MRLHFLNATSPIYLKDKTAMCATDTERSKKYSDTRSSFDDLGLDEKAAFLVESTIKMVIQSVQDAGDAASQAIKNISADIEPGSSDSSDGTTSKAKNTEKNKPGKSSGEKKNKGASAKSKSETGQGDSSKRADS